MRGRMMRLVHADLGEGASADLPAEHERDDAREIALVRQHLEIEHQPDVIGERGRDAGRLIDERQFVRALTLRPLNPPFDVAYGFQVLAELGAIARSNALTEPV